MEKIKVSQDTLYQYLVDHDVKMIRLAELMGMSRASVTSCFKHQIINGGVARSFTPAAIGRINDALSVISGRLRSGLLQFGSSQVFTSSRGTAYDPALIEPLKQIGEVVNLTALLQRALGWSKAKKMSVIVTEKSQAYGHITKEDTDRINAELLSIAAVLESYEVVADGK